MIYWNWLLVAGLGGIIIGAIVVGIIVAFTK